MICPNCGFGNPDHAQVCQKCANVFLSPAEESNQWDVRVMSLQTGKYPVKTRTHQAPVPPTQIHTQLPPNRKVITFLLSIFTLVIIGGLIYFGYHYQYLFFEQGAGYQIILSPDQPVSINLDLKQTNAAGGQQLDQTQTVQNQEESHQSDVAQDDFVDTDNDGLSDEQENNLFQTDPNNPDTDGDGYPDGVEVENGYNPLSL